MSTTVSPRVLIIDDDEQLLALAGLALAKEGVAVETATTGHGGLELLATNEPDLVILDIVLDDLSGWETLRRIRESSDVPVMLLTGRDTDVDKARGLDLGADDYLTKPFSFLEFEARVRALLRRSSRRNRHAGHLKAAVDLDVEVRAGERSMAGRPLAPGEDGMSVRLEAETDR